MSSASRGNDQPELSESVLKVVALSSQQSARLSQELAQCPSMAKTDDSQLEVQRHLTQISSEGQIAQFVSQLLKSGVLLASTVVLTGGVLYLIRYGTELAEYEFFRGEPAAFRSLWGVSQAVLARDPRGIIQLGILLLIATPIARVAFSLLFFFLQRDLIYVFVTSFVLVGLLCSLLIAYF